MVNKFNLPSSFSPEGKREYQKLYLRERRARERGFNSYADYEQTKPYPTETRKLQNRIAYLESEVTRLQKCLEVALCKKQ